MARLMKTARAWCVGLTVAAASMLACAAPTEAPQDGASVSPLVSQVAAQLAQAKGVRAQFVQTQSLQAMQKPLVSSGTLLFLRDQGALWRIEHPTRMTYVMTDAGVTTLDANDKPMARGARNAAGVAQVSRMMRAMLAGDLSALYSQFNVNAQGSASRWQLNLTPAQPQLAQALRGLDLTGDSYVRSIRIRSANGDETRIEFTGSTHVDAPNATERALLGAP
ncbi:outer membrane lipoprotein carrier protein LolA [Ralstonia sp. UBA689]|uniref:outer membrane lipoprotein carrier protein LolA n=1 Tax=Ralstonia sp. UBA689 TaxID=1947373 RepID=UPI0025F2BB61|nr:outer membrane lipoprotein carrier protein LolA [Ralstonia sp. UBA689]